MSQKRVDRPIKSNNKVEVHNLIVEFLPQVANNYGAEVCYLLFVSKDPRKNMKFITILEDDGIKMPYWVIDDKQKLYENVRM